MRSWELVNKFRLHENNLKNLLIAILKGASIFNVLKDEPFYFVDRGLSQFYINV